MLSLVQCVGSLTIQTRRIKKTGHDPVKATQILVFNNFFLFILTLIWTLGSS